MDVVKIQQRIWKFCGAAQTLLPSQTVVMWVVTSCSPIGRCWHFTATCAFVFRVKGCRVARKVASRTGFAAYTLPPWWWRQQFLWNICICVHPRRLPSQQSPSWKPLQRIPFVMCAVIYLHVLICRMFEQFVREVFCLSIRLTFLKVTTIINDPGMWIWFYQLLVENKSDIYSFMQVKFRQNYETGVDCQLFKIHDTLCTPFNAQCKQN
jgi:hypothetical protein